MAACLSESQAVASSAWERMGGSERSISVRLDGRAADGQAWGRNVESRSHISSVARTPNANTRFVQSGPRLEPLWLDEAYARARGSMPPR